VPDLQHILTDRFKQAITAAIGTQHAGIDPQLRPSTRIQFGDYQANLAMNLAKQIGQNPRQLAQQIVDHLDLSGVCDKAEVAGPGFINLYLSAPFLDQQLATMVNDPRLGVAAAHNPQTVVVDYSGPNVAKDMHVGHLRSTCIGDAIAQVLQFQGHNVIRQNHIGDWGTQFGMLIQYLEENTDQRNHLDHDLNKLYQAAKQQFDQDTDFADRARNRVVELQSGTGTARQWWETLVNQSRQRFQKVYQQLDVSLTDADVRGESCYNPMLPQVIDALTQLGVAIESEGALCVFPKGFINREGQPQPLIIRKADGGYLYATTDLAAAWYRIDTLGADRVIYVTDARQSQHFSMVFSVLKQDDWAFVKQAARQHPQVQGTQCTRLAGPELPGAELPGVRLDHVPFGAVLGKDNKPFKTRSGQTVKLVDLLDEAHRRAMAVIEHKNPQIPITQQQQIAHAIGIGALKYADLSNDRIKDYVFDWDRMLAFEGNTAPYLQNAYVRIRSIFRKGKLDPDQASHDPITIKEPPERAVAVKLLQLPAVIDSVAQSLEPHRLCTYLYELASAYHQFYEACSVLNANDEPTRHSRLALSNLVAKTLKSGLNLLGISVVEQM